MHGSGVFVFLTISDILIVNFGGLRAANLRLTVLFCSSTQHIWFNWGSDMTSIDSSIFRAYDIRGVVADALTPAAVEQIGRSFGSEALARGQSTVVLARDGRLSGPDLIQALAKGLQSAGCDVINIGMVPTPVLYFATYHLETGTGIMAVSYTHLTLPTKA